LSTIGGGDWGCRLSATVTVLLAQRFADEKKGRAVVAGYFGISEETTVKRQSSVYQSIMPFDQIPSQLQTPL